MNTKTTTKSKEIRITDSQRAGELGVCRQTFQKWSKLPGAPARNAPVADWIAFMQERDLGKRSGGSDPDKEEKIAVQIEILDSKTEVICLEIDKLLGGRRWNGEPSATLPEARLRYLTAQRDRGIIDLRVAKGELLDEREVSRVVMPYWKSAMDRLKGLKHQIAQMLVGLNAEQAEKVIEEALTEAMAQFQLPDVYATHPFYGPIIGDLKAQVEKLVREGFDGIPSRPQVGKKKSGKI